MESVPSSTDEAPVHQVVENIRDSNGSGFRALPRHSEAESSGAGGSAVVLSCPSEAVAFDLPRITGTPLSSTSDATEANQVSRGQVNDRDTGRRGRCKKIRGRYGLDLLAVFDQLGRSKSYVELNAWSDSGYNSS
jgi:hypothetical protein